MMVFPSKIMTIILKLKMTKMLTLPMVRGWVSTPVTSLFRPLVISSTPGSGLPVYSHLVGIELCVNQIQDIPVLCSENRSSVTHHLWIVSACALSGLRIFSCMPHLIYHDMMMMMMMILIMMMMMVMIVKTYITMIMLMI